MQHALPEPFRFKAIERIHLPSAEEREQALKEANFNMFALKARDVYIDLLTDSGTGALSKEQWAALMLGDESYAGADSFFRLRESVKEMLGFDHVIPAHQGRAAENILIGSLVKPGDLIPINMPFDTTRAHMFNAQATPVNCVVDAAFQPELEQPFKGNVDIARLEDALRTHGDRIPFVMVTVTNNSGGGQPVSLQNLRDVSAMARKYGKKLFLDAARMAENAFFIKEREPECAGMSVAAILRAMMDTADGATISCKKDPMVNIGGLVVLRSEEDYMRLLPRVVLFEGFITYGGLAGRDLDALAVGLREMADEEYLAHRLSQVRMLGDMLIEGGVPIIRPVGGHAIFIDAGRFFPHIPQKHFPADVLSIEIYREGAVRGVGLGALAFEDKDPVTGEKIMPKLELYRMAIARRTYSNSHMEYIARTVIEVYRRRDAVRYGLRLTYEPPVPGITHFLARLEPFAL